MSWKSTKDKERFFQELDRAFNTPSTKDLILPRIAKDDLISSTAESFPKRKSESEEAGTKRRRSLPGPDNRRSSMKWEIGPVDVGKPILPRRVSAGNSRRLETPEKSSAGDKASKKSGLLNGMILFFIPNSKKNGVRRYRMTLFAEHGADVRDTWNHEITHIICDKGVNAERVMRDLKWEQLPVSPFPKPTN
jgi:BRCA1 C Terminus (BRCT) domain